MKNICIVFMLFAASLNAQISLQGKLANVPLIGVRQMALECWNVDRWQQKAVVYLDPDNTFSTPLIEAAPGQYRLRIWGEARMWSDFIVADSAMADTALQFSLDCEQMDGRPAQIDGSRANLLYFDLLSAQWRLNQLRENSSPASAAQVDAAQSDLNQQCQDIASQNRNTLIGDIALLLYQPDKSDYRNNEVVVEMTANEFVKAYELDKIPFHHQNILFHNAFIKHLNRYFNYFEHDSTGCKAYIDGIMARRNGDDLVDAFLFKYLLDKTLDYRQEEALSYLLTWYAPDCTDESPLPNGTQSLIKALEICAPGNVAPNLSLSDLAGQPADLGEICSKHKLTLMLFWRSTCSHCKEFEPELEKLYEKYHSLGLEVYALSIDKTEDDWRHDLQKHATPWVNVFIPQEKRKEISRTYPSPSTPTLIALDKHRRVINRVLSRGTLDAYLDNMLHKME